MKPEEVKTPEFKLEERKVKALEKIANSIDALTVWFEEIDKEEWSGRIQYYLAEWKKTVNQTDEDEDDCGSMSSKKDRPQIQPKEQPKPKVEPKSPERPKIRIIPETKEPPKNKI